MTKNPIHFLKTSLTLFFFFLTALPFKVISQPPDSERSVLLKLRRQWGNSLAMANWTSSSSPCDWPEIQCSGDGSSVTGISLREKEITAKIPAAICDLKNLSFLDLAVNYIPGEFPEVLYGCSNLQHLDLSQNLFVGTIPGDIDRLSGLRFLDLSGNNFSGDVPESLGRVSELLELNLHMNLFNGTVSSAIGNLANLEFLRLAYNGLLAPAPIPPEFGRLKNLKELWMTEMNLVGNIPESFADLESLVKLDLSMNNLEGKIPNGLLLLKNLKSLLLYQNKLSGEIPARVEAVKISEIDISINNLTGPIPEDFGKLSNLTYLFLYSNRLSGAIPASLGLIRTLRILRVFKNSLNGTLPPELGLNSKLEKLELSDNGFTGELPENLCANRALQGIIVFSNSLSGELPKGLGQCHSLETIHLYGNKFSGEIPSGMWQLRNLSTVMISNNSFSGELPSEMSWNMSRLEICNNQFSGEIPKQVSTWKALVVVKASNNKFSGKIPTELTSLSLLTTLLLDGNRFSGELPEKIISWKSLDTLNLSKNELSGLIPKSLGSLPDLLYLDLSENRFSGEIPEELGHLRLNTLDLSSNNLSGKVPSEYDNLAYGTSFLNNPQLCSNSGTLALVETCGRRAELIRLRHPRRLSSPVLAAVLTLAIVIFIATLTLSILAFRRHQRKKRSRDIATWKLTSFQRLDFTEYNVIKDLTENNLIGSGGSGKVYRVSTNCPGEFVAVKRISNSHRRDEGLEREFLAEVRVLGMIRHSNIVKLLCCVSGENSKLLVYEYMENQSLDVWLHGKKRKSSGGEDGAGTRVLEWPMRLRIAIGAAQGLCYMHHECSPPIIHRDVKSSNILLDSEFRARIADFGLARILLRHGDPHTVSAIAGSFGYIAPEYAYMTKVNEKIDVYSFGVVLLELATGREPSCGDENMSLTEWAWQHYGDEKPIYDALDEEIKMPCYSEEITTLFKLGLMCTSTSPSARPSIKEVLQILHRFGNTDTQKAKRTGSEFDVAPLLGNTKYLASYKRKNVSEDDNDETFFSATSN